MREPIAAPHEQLALARQTDGLILIDFLGILVRISWLSKLLVDQLVLADASVLWQSREQLQHFLAGIKQKSHGKKEWE